MGIKKGNTLFKKYGNEISLDILKDNIVIVDLFYILHKFTRIDISNPLYYMLEVINIIDKFKYYGIKPIFVIDGRPLVEKSRKLKRTREKSGIKLTELLNNNETYTDTKKADSLLKKSISITREHIDNCKDLFNRLNCLYIHIAFCEGDTVIAELISLLSLQKNNTIHGCSNTESNAIGNEHGNEHGNGHVYVYSADFDMFLYKSINYILKDLDFEKDTFKLYIKEDILHDLHITQDELIVSGFITGTDLNCGIYKATMETSIELNEIYGPFKTLNDFIDALPKINSSREINHKMLIPSYNFIDRYELVTNTFSLNNTSSFTRTSIMTFINEKLKTSQEEQHKNTLSNLFNVKYVLEYIQIITQDSYLITKYRAKITEYSKRHFGFTIHIDNHDDYDDSDNYDYEEYNYDYKDYNEYNYDQDYNDNNNDNDNNYNYNSCVYVL